MGDWNFLGGILEEVHIHSTMVGKIWLTILFIFRMLVLGVAAEDVWNDEQSDFVCNTEQPGCRNVCYDRAFPISLIRYWVLQVIFVSSPSLVYMGHAIYRLRALEKERHCKKVALRRELESVDAETADARRRIEKEMRGLEQGKLNKAPLRGSLLCTYVAHIVTRAVVEVSFMTGQLVLYGNRLGPLYKCDRRPCPNVVDCFVSRPTEKTVFMVFMQVIACISLFLSLLEIIHLGYKKIKKGILEYYPHIKEDLDDFYVNKSKKNSVVHQVCAGTSAGGRKASAPAAPGGFSLLLEKQGNGPNYALLNTASAFAPVREDPGVKPAGFKESREGVPSPADQNSNNASSQTRSPPADEPDRARYPASSDAPSCAALPAAAARKSRRPSPQWNCSTVLEGNASDSGDSYRGGPVKLHRGSVRNPLAKPDSARRPGRPRSPDSAGDASSPSRRSRDSPSPAASSPNRRVSATSSGGSGSRRAPTDLQV
ncbi:gap junction alpha-9 protein-like isoform X1 [Syngnathoides biaculeatus]|uniref:gap junction alpha-9 protein-like isoform X1 n=1 Tax=Syngnathoides biaculeatus TaxID=300417 RepID=UPI002ADE2ECC|nr:gap junction alpha-9 protein-like isoform X1 [Syngnathoides biaculeatus]XP_061679787.1 gap junction alpha-9 protein-like isoform X1 [Syngnathoides biaculeatus]